MSARAVYKIVFGKWIILEGDFVVFARIGVAQERDVAVDDSKLSTGVFLEENHV